MPQNMNPVDKSGAAAATLPEGVRIDHKSGVFTRKPLADPPTADWDEPSQPMVLERPGSSSSTDDALQDSNDSKDSSGTTSVSNDTSTKPKLAVRQKPAESTSKPTMDRSRAAIEAKNEPAPSDNSGDEETEKSSTFVRPEKRMRLRDLR